MRQAAVIATLALAIAACSSDDAATTTTQPPPTTTAAPTSTTATVPATTTTTTVAPTSTTAPTTTTTTVPSPTTFDAEWTFTAEIADEEQPALPAAGDGGRWDGTFRFSPEVVIVDGVHHMFYTGWGPVRVAIGLATSEDGRVFEPVGEEPILEIREPVAGRTALATAPVVRIADDGTWVMYFGHLISKRFPGRALLRATAPAPEGPWEIDPEPVFTTGSGDWDAQFLPQSIAPHDGGFVLVYDGPESEVNRVGALRSDDGVTFTPVADDPVMEESPVPAWDAAGPASPVLFTGPDGELEMFYVGLEGQDRTLPNELRLGYARSTDGGATWERFAGNPVVTIPTQGATAGSLGYPWLGGARVGEAYRIYYALSAGANGIGFVDVVIDR
ncbi:MAG: hypothetical protein R3290_08255 [Acidimicrobiia bacterium]|nr:hypothetical protein [Acidimicrobiia bacterium]